MKKAFFALALFLAFTQPAVAATLHGEIFSWENLGLVEGAAVTVDSTPEQRIVSTDGAYSFDLPAGGYIVRAELVENNMLVLFADENVSIETDGNFRLDLIMFPPVGEYESDLLLPELDSGITNETFSGADKNVLVESPPGSAPAQGNNAPGNDALFLGAIVAALLGIIAAGVLAFFRKKEKAKPIQQNRPAQLPEAEKGNAEKLDKYALEVLDVLRRSGNRLTQKQLREKISSIGGAKISLIVSELEAAGKVKKIKQGRGNIVVLKEK